MGTHEGELARIRKYVRENMDYFCSPLPRAWAGPGLAGSQSTISATRTNGSWTFRKWNP